MPHAEYDCDELIAVLRAFKERHPNLRLILEPGSAFTWRTGTLVATVEDIVVGGGENTLVANVSFACHMPDCLEMPYQPAILSAVESGAYSYRMGGNSCLSGDFIGDWSFDHELQVGEKIVLMDMIHYTTVKTTMFNGVSHPSLMLWTKDSELKLLRSFSYEDYKNRMA